MKKLLRSLTALLLACALCMTAAAETVSWPDPGIAENNITDATPATDFAAWVNADWLAETTLPEGYPRWTAFSELNTLVTQQCADLLEDPAEDNENAQLLSAFYHQFLDEDTRNEAGFGSVTALVDAVNACGTAQELATLLTEDRQLRTLNPFTVLFRDIDLKDSTRYVVYVRRP